MHKHYCKGILESVSVFYAGKCSDHSTATVPDACCKKEGMDNCSAGNNSCCTHEVTVVSKQADYLASQLAKWMVPALLPVSPLTQDYETGTLITAAAAPAIQTDTGPPLYILHSSLIIYA